MNEDFYTKYLRYRLLLGNNFVFIALASDVTEYRVKKAFATDSKYANT